MLFRSIGRLADELLRDPARIAVSPTASTVDSVTQRVLHVESRNKRSLLIELFADPQISRALVFTRTKRGADRVARHLDAAGIRVAAIHGNKSQSQREHALAAFRAARIRVLVATDIAARGIDVDHVTHVVNYELPDVPECYVHRIGRTARAGAAGIAISLCDADERNLLRDIERLTRQAIPAEDRREEAGRLSDRPARGGPTSGHPGGQANRAGDAHGGWPRRTGRRQPSPRTHQRQGSASNHARSPTAGPGRHHPRKQSANRGDSA